MDLGHRSTWTVDWLTAAGGFAVVEGMSEFALRLFAVPVTWAASVSNKHSFGGELFVTVFFCTKTNVWGGKATCQKKEGKRYRSTSGFSKFITSRYLFYYYIAIVVTIILNDKKKDEKATFGRRKCVVP